MLKIIIRISVWRLGLGLLLTFLLYKGYLRFNYPSSEEFPVQGIDISHHQGEIRWDELKKEAIEFVFIKATEGGDFTDPKFADNWRNAKKNNYHVGAYHFYRICKNGKEQAENIIRIVPKNADNLPPVIDLEFGGNCHTDKTKEQIRSEIQDCLDRLEKYYMQTPILYSTTQFYTEYIKNKFSEYPIWIRTIYGRPKLPDKRAWTFWQFANRGHLGGIDGYTDLNVFNGTMQELIELK